MPQQTNEKAAEIAKKYHNQKSAATKKRRFGYVRVPTQFQMEVSECGAASLSMILMHYGRYVPLEELRIETGVSRNGCNAKNIYIAGEKYGMKVEASSRDVERLLQKNRPGCMLHWNFSHFVVFEGIKWKKYYINDPQYGRRKLSREDFVEGYSGTVLQFTPGENFKKEWNKKSLFKFMRERLKNQRVTLLALFLIGVIQIFPGVIHPLFSQVFVDDILVNARYSWAKWLLLAIFMTMIFDNFFSYISGQISIYLRTKMSLLNSDTMISHMLRLPMSFFEQRYAGDLVQRINNNMSMSEFLSGQLLSVTISLITSIVYLLLMLAYSPMMTFIGVGFAVVSVLLSIVTSKKMFNATMKFGMDTGKLMGALYNGLAGSSSIKAVGAEGEYVSRLLGYYTEVGVNDQKLGSMQTRLDVIPKALNSFNTVLLLLVGSLFVVKGDLTPGMLMTFSGFLGSFSGPFSNIASFVRSMQQAKLDMARVQDIMHYDEEENYTCVKDTSLKGKKLRGEVELKDISFAYGKLDKPFIKNFNFHVKSGHSVALVGTSGCGKSTISKMLSCLYKPMTGEVLIDEVNVENIPQEVINASVAVVTQNISLFDGTIYDNITTWNPGITHQDVVMAAKDACIHDEIIQKNGAYDYELKENGSNISGGQRQRIEIAKALSINPTLLVLDEATSALDAITEKKILDNIRKRKCTCVVVAQRLSTIRDCDEIIVMEHGKIKERGTHDYLMSIKGTYHKLVSESD